MFWHYFCLTGIGMLQIFLIGACGFFLVKKGLIDSQGLESLSSFVVNVSLPCLVVSGLIVQFDEQLFRYWWIFPLLSVTINAVGFILARFVIVLMGDMGGAGREFSSLVAFQNSGYLPLMLSAQILPPDLAKKMFIFIFLFILGFNMLFWSWGPLWLSNNKKRFVCRDIFSPTAIATCIGLLLVFSRLGPWIPQALIKPMEMIGSCTLPLGVVITGGTLAQVRFREHLDWLSLGVLSLAKLICLPLMGLGCILLLRPSGLISLLIILETSMPSALSHGVISRLYQLEDRLTSQGIFYTHLFSLVTIPIFLSLMAIFVNINGL
jgi:predicted permease